jgi:TPR repeat protein
MKENPILILALCATALAGCCSDGGGKRVRAWDPIGPYYTPDLKDLDSAVKEWEKGNYFYAVPKFKEIVGDQQNYKMLYHYSELHFGVAYYYLGAAYYEGKGVEKDYKRAYSNFDAASRRSSSEAGYALALCNLHGRGTAKNESSAFYLMRSAARKFPEAMYNLAILYRDGIGTEKDPVKAKEWMKKAAECGVQQARKALEEWP